MYPFMVAINLYQINPGFFVQLNHS